MERDFLDSLTDPVALYEDAPCGYLSFTADGKIIKINQTLLDWLDQERENVLHKKYLKDLITRGGSIYYEMYYFPLLKMQAKVEEINFDFVRADGSRFPGLLNSNTIRSKDDQILAINATIFNITDRKKYENELLEAKKRADGQRLRFEFLSDFVPEMIWTADSRGLINYVNKRFVDYFGSTNGTVDLFNNIHEKDRTRFLRTWLLAIKSETSFSAQVRLKSKTGVHKYHLIQALPSRDEKKKVTEWVGTCTNVDNQANALMRMDEFISVASHELKTPLTTLKGTLQLMDRIKTTLPAAHRLSGLIDTGLRNIEKILTLTTDLLNTDRIKKGQIQLLLSTFDIREFLTEFTADVDTRGREINIELDGDYFITADRMRLEQVLQNFVTNAAKYAPGNTALILKAEQANQGFRISLTDQGAGIPAEKLPYLFDRYYRADHKGVQYSGLGLGLYICAQIVEKHGGKIGADSTLGRGSTFWFTIPG